MIHYSCDRCGKLIDTQSEIRYVVRVEVQAAIDSSEEDAGVKANEIQEIIERLEGTEHAEIGSDLLQHLRYDMCSCCQREYVQNPLAKESQLLFGFSEN